MVEASRWWRHPWACRSANTKNSLRTTARYIDAFFANIRWDVVAARAEAL